MNKTAIMTKAALFTAIAISAFLTAGCAAPDSDSQDSTSKVAPTSKVGIVASFYPLAEFARQTGGDLVSVTTVIPAGAEPHDFEPTPRDIAGINDSALFIYNGGAVDPWAKKTAQDLPPSVRTLEMASVLGIDSQDPHFWVDPVLVQKEVEAIRDAISSVDPANSATYEKNAEAFITELQRLDSDFSEGLLSCQSREIFTSHAAFSYLAARYGLTQVSIAGLSPEAEPSARELAELIKTAKEKQVKYIFFETLASPKLAETLSAEIGARTLVLNPLEGLTADETAAGMDYLSVMRQNLANLRLALQCQ